MRHLSAEEEMLQVLRNIWEGMLPESRRAVLAPEDRLAGLSTNQILELIPIDQLLASVPLEMRLQGLTPEQREQLRQLLSRPDKDDPAGSK